MTELEDTEALVVTEGQEEFPGEQSSVSEGVQVGKQQISGQSQCEELRSWDGQAETVTTGKQP